MDYIQKHHGGLCFDYTNNTQIIINKNTKVSENFRTKSFDAEYYSKFLETRCYFFMKYIS